MAKTFGQFLVDEQLPSDLQSTGPVDKRELHRKLYAYAQRDPVAAAQAMDNLRRLGHELATTEGDTISLEDITPNYEERNAILKPILRRMQKTESPDVRQKYLVDAQERLLATVRHFPGSQGETLRSGARGSPAQLMRTFIAPVAARDSKGGMYPWLIHHSYSEGLRPSEHFANAVESRLNIISSHYNITEPGDFSKILINNTTDQLILAEDCGTKNGISMASDDPNIIDRFIAKPIAGFPHNTAITPQVATKLRKETKTVIVRSPMTCELNDGICQKCYGKNEKGKLQTLGTNVGVRSAQAITEPLTQFTLSARHGLQRGGAKKTEPGGMKGLRQFLDIPETFTNRAALAPTAGTVTRIEKAPQGGHMVYVGENGEYIPPHLDPVVHVDQTVSAGDALSNGVPMPDEVVRHKGLGAGQKYIVERLQKIYQDQGVDLDRRHFEIVARTQLNKVQIDDDPERRFYPGEVVNYAAVRQRLAEDSQEVPLRRAVGSVLARPYLHYTAGTTVTDDVRADLGQAKIRTVEVASHPPLMTPVMYSSVQNPLLNPDWMARLGHRQLKQSILEGAHFGQQTDIHGTHPIPSYSFGKEFGKGKGGRY